MKFPALPARLLIFGCAAAVAGAQIGPSPATQAPPVVVRAAALPNSGYASWSLASPEAGDAWNALNGAVPDFHASEGGVGGFGSLFALRGLANTPYFSEPAVTVYFEDIPLPAGFTYPAGLAGFTAANLYYGPQGTRFGRATDGGVVVFSAGDFPAGGEADLSSGSYRDRRGSWIERAGTGGGGAQLTAAAAYGAREGYITNGELGRPVDDQEEESVFARARWRPAPAARVALEILGQRAREGAQPLVPLGGPLYEVRRAQEGRTDLDGRGAALRAEVDVRGGTLRSVTSATSWALNPYSDFLVLPPPLQSVIIQRENSWNEELQFESDPRARFSGRAGVWLSRASTHNFTSRQIPGLFPIETSGFDQRASEGAAFAEIAAQLDPAWRLSAGIRAETDQKQFLRREQVPVPGLDFAGEGRYGAALPRLALAWTGEGGRSAEASASAGLRPGGFSSFTDNPALMPFAAERVMAYALAWTWAPPRADAALTLRAFDEEIRNDQIERSFTATDYFVATAARARARGLEAEGRWHPLPGLSATAAAGWTDAVLTRYRAPLSGQDLSGHAAPDVPLFTARLEAAYRWRGGWFVSARLADTGRIYYDELESAAFEQPAVATVAAGGGYAAARWSVTLEAQNLAQARYYQLIVPGVQSGVPGAPRTLEAETSLTW